MGQDRHQNGEEFLYQKEVSAFETTSVILILGTFGNEPKNFKTNPMQQKFPTPIIRSQVPVKPPNCRTTPCRQSAHLKDLDCRGPGPASTHRVLVP